MIRYAVVTMDKSTGLSKGNGFVCFQNEEDAERCLKDYEEAAALLQVSGQLHGDVEDESDGKKDKVKKSILTPILPETVPQETQKFRVDGRFISVTPAVSKQIATKLTQASNLNRRAQDKRNLYLMREGVIFPGTEAASHFTTEEVEKKMEQFAARKRLLATNPNLFVSRTRLSVRGLHPKLTDAQLKAAARIAINGFWADVEAGDRQPLEEEVVQEEKEQGYAIPGPKRKIVIAQAKIIKDMDRLDPVTKKPKSKGYGFIEFKSHADALACLRYMNNNIAAFAKAMGEEEHAKNSKKKIPTADFAVENNLILKKRRERESNKHVQDGSKRKAGEEENAREGTKKKSKHEKSRDVPQKQNTDVDKVGDKSKKDVNPPKDKKNGKSATISSNSNSIRQGKSSDLKRHSDSLKQRKPSKVMKKSIASIPEKLPKRQYKREKKAGEEQKFESLVTNYKKKLLDNATVTKSATSKWYS
jgi:nucleolar protein 4